MTAVVNDELDERLYGAFWQKLQQSKYDLIYYSLHFNNCIKISRIIKYTIIFVTSLATGAWMNWNDIDWVGNTCAIVILISQAISAISELFPYESRKLELRELTAELEPIYIGMENDWRSIQNSKISNSEIQELIQSYDKKQAEIKRHYLKEDALPDSEKIRLQADEKTEEYFKYMNEEII